MSEDLANKLLSTGEGRILMTACREQQKSWFLTNEPLTIFSQALVDGLRGKSVTPRGGLVTAFDLYTAIHNQVKQRAAKLGHEQEPELTIIKGVGPFAVSLYRGVTNTNALEVKRQTVPKDRAIRSVSRKTINQIQKQLNGNRAEQTEVSNGSVYVKHAESHDQSTMIIGPVNGPINIDRH